MRVAGAVSYVHFVGVQQQRVVGRPENTADRVVSLPMRRRAECVWLGGSVAPFGARLSVVAPASVVVVFAVVAAVAFVGVAIIIAATVNYPNMFRSWLCGSLKVVPLRIDRAVGSAD